MNKVKLQKNYK